MQTLNSRWANVRAMSTALRLDTKTSLHLRLETSSECMLKLRGIAQGPGMHCLQYQIHIDDACRATTRLWNDGLHFTSSVWAPRLSRLLIGSTSWLRRHHRRSLRSLSFKRAGPLQNVEGAHLQRKGHTNSQSGLWLGPPVSTITLPLPNWNTCRATGTGGLLVKRSWEKVLCAPIHVWFLCCTIWIRQWVFHNGLHTRIYRLEQGSILTS